MDLQERRTLQQHSNREMRLGLNTAQLNTLAALEMFGWSLKYVRRPLFQPTIPILFDAARNRFGVLEADGHFDEHPTLRIRPH